MASPLHSGIRFFKALRLKDRYDPQLVHAIVTRDPEEIEHRLNHFADSYEIAFSEEAQLTLNQLNLLETDLLNKPLELAIKLHGISETTEKNSYFCINTLIENFEKVINHAEYFQYPKPDLKNILKLASEHEDPLLFNFILNAFSENKTHPEFHEEIANLSKSYIF